MAHYNHHIYNWVVITRFLVTAHLFWSLLAPLDVLHFLEPEKRTGVKLRAKRRRLKPRVFRDTS